MATLAVILQDWQDVFVKSWRNRFLRRASAEEGRHQNRGQNSDSFVVHNAILQAHFPLCVSLTAVVKFLILLRARTTQPHQNCYIR